ncbi:MAG: hypothetical protein MUE73_03675 [Planctomycetes bacterium]|jgi:hypothetical protein|nr:hypothetical protein [Planctomycetota bacterium]
MSARVLPPTGGRGDTPGEFRSVHAIRDAVPTRRHAEMLLDEAERAEPRFPPAPPGFTGAAPPPDFTLRWFRLVDERTGARVPPVVRSKEGGCGFSAARLDGGRLRWCAVRLRPERP